MKGTYDLANNYIIQGKNEQMSNIKYNPWGKNLREYQFVFLICS